MQVIISGRSTGCVRYGAFLTRLLTGLWPPGIILALNLIKGAYMRSFLFLPIALSIFVISSCASLGEIQQRLATDKSLPLILPDGSEWACATNMAAFPVRRYHTSVVFNGLMWIFGGWTNSAAYSDVWCSEDGVLWTQVTSSASFKERSTDNSIVVYNNKLWLVGGSTATDVTNDVWSSSDGTNWNIVTSAAAFSARYHFPLLVFKGKMWLIGGALDGSLGNNKNDVYFSEDGTNWVCASASAGFSPRCGHSGVIFNNKMWIIGGCNNTISYNDIWYSSDGTNWVCATNHTAFTPRCLHSSIVFDNKIWVIAGISNKNASISTRDIWNSTDGINWNCVTSNADFSRRYSQSCVSYNDSIWIIGGAYTFSSPQTNDVWYTK